MKQKKGHTYIQWIVAIIANTTMLTFGLQSGWISPSSSLLQSNHSPLGVSLSDSELSWMASSLCISAAISITTYAYLADKYGRKICIFILAVFQLISWIITICAKSSVSLLVARICCGLGSGAVFTVVPIYVKEISQDDIRGLLGSLLMLYYNVGTLVMYAMGSYLEYYTVLWISTCIPVVTLVCMVKVPESPSFLIKNGEIDKAIESIALLRGLDKDDKSVLNEINALETENIYHKSLPSISFMSILKNKAWRRSTILLFAMITVHAGNGYFAVLTFASTILSSFNVSVNPELQSLSIPTVMIVGSLLSMTCVERFGRKPLLAVTLVITVLSMSCIGTSLLLHQRGHSVPGWLPILALVIAMFVYALGASPVPYIVMAEIFNFQIRSTVIGYILTYSWMVSFSLLATFTPMVNALSLCSVFYLYSGINLFGVFVCLVFLPETRGKTVEKIEEEMNGRGS